MGKIILKEDLNRQTLEELLCEHFNDSKLKIISTDTNDNFLAENDNCNSNIQKLTITIERQNEVCYYCHSNYLDSFLGQKKLAEKLCCMLCWPILLPPESGILLTDNLCDARNNLKTLDKRSVMTFHQTKIILEALARFHGIWLKWMHQSKESDNTASRLKPEHLQDLTLKIKVWMVRNMILKTVDAVAKLLKNQKVDDDIIRRWEEYGRTKLVQRSVDLRNSKKELKLSRIVTVCHGDFWSNNILMTKDEDQVAFIDYQMLSLLHPALDIWYLLTVNTDKELRSAHLPALLEHYFLAFHHYIKDVVTEFTFEDFSKEFYERRDGALGMSLLTMPNVLSPYQINMDGWNFMNRINRKRELEIGGDPSPDDHPMILEIRRRIIGVVLEATEANFI